MAEIGIDIEKAKSLLEKGELIGMPTETVYGLAGNALNTEAVAKIFKTKNRPAFDPLIVHIASMEGLNKVVCNVPEKAKILAERFWPGPITLLLPKRSVIPDLVTSGMDTVAVRVPGLELTRELLSRLDFPLVAPSANPFGYVSPTTAQHVNDQLGDRIPYILDGGPCTVGIESTIVGFDGDTPIIHRLGGTSKEKIESIVGKVKVQPHSSSNPKAPGMLKSHYSPGTPMIAGDLETLIAHHKEKRVAVISFNKAYDVAYSEVLAPDGNLNTAAQNLFGIMRKLDQAAVDIILCEYVPDHGLGRAINDRLKRAVAKKN